MPPAAPPSAECIRDFLRYMTKQLETAERLAGDQDLIDGTFGNLFESVAKSLTARRRSDPAFAGADLEAEVMKIMNGLLDAVPDRPGIADFFLSYMQYDRVAAMNLRRILESMAEPRDVAELLDLVAEAARGLDAAGDITNQPYREGLAILCRSCSSPNGIQGTWYQLKILREAVEAGKELSDEHGISAEVIDIRTVKPLDKKTILASTAKTGRLVVADAGWRSFGVAAEIMASVAESGIRLKTPSRRVAIDDVPAPAASSLEKIYYPSSKDIVRAARSAMKKKL
jgi:hypothetical protein